MLFKKKKKLELEDCTKSNCLEEVKLPYMFDEQYIENQINEILKKMKKRKVEL